MVTLMMADDGGDVDGGVGEMYEGGKVGRAVLPP